MKTFYVTFGIAHPLAKYYVVIMQKTLTKLGALLEFSLRDMEKFTRRKIGNSFLISTERRIMSIMT